MRPGQALALGRRMATSAVRTRLAVVLSTAAGALIGALLLATALGLTPRIAAANGCLAGDLLCVWRVRLSLIVVLATPGVLLGVSTSRVSADLRTRQLRRLLDLGVPAPFLRAATVTESGLLAVPPTVAGAALALLLLVAVLGATASSVLLPVTAAVLVGLVITVLSALLGVRSASRPRPRPRRPSRPAGRPRLLGAVICVLGAVALLVAAVLPRSGSAETGLDLADLRMAAWTTGTVLTLVGAPACAEAIAGWCGRLLGARAPWPSARVAGRVLRERPSSVGRLLGTYVGVLMVAILAQSVWQGFIASPLTRAAIDAEAGGPNYALVDFPDPVTGIDSLQQRDVVEGAEPWTIASCADASCGNVLVADCDQLAFLTADARVACDPQAVTQLASASDLRGRTLTFDFVPGAAAFTVPSDAEVVLEEAESLGVQGGLEVTAVIPPALLGLPAAGSTRWVLSLTAGNATVDALAEANPTVRIVSLSGGTELYRQTVGVRDVLLGIVLSGLVAVMASLVVAAVDRGVERRELFSRLHALGAPTAFTRRTLLWEQLVPVTFATILATSLAALSCTVGIYESQDARSPAATALRTGAIGLATTVVLLVAAVWSSTALHEGGVRASD
ncbi:MAG TPA: hypothetical protein VGC67_08440 [Cellulomonas sp.]